MKYLRYRTQAGVLLDALFTSEGEFIGCDDAETEARVLASHSATLEQALGVRGLVAVTSTTDPWNGAAPLLAIPGPPPTPRTLSALERALTALAADPGLATVTKAALRDALRA